MIITEKNENDILLPPDPKRVMEGLRDTGYNFNTAIADIIDNSIAANATKIDITIDLNPQKELTVYIADDGIGMNEKELQNAMRYGSKRRDDPSSLGKFGLGLKTGSTAFCRCLSVISRGSNDNSVLKVQWDLDYIAKTNAWNLKVLTVNEDEIDILDETANGNTGTLVVWENIDRLLRTYNNKSSAQVALKKVLESLMFHISMVYQRFLDINDNRANNISITLNGANIEAWNPFCEREEFTEKLADETVDVEMPDGTVSSFIIRAYMLPRRDDFSTAKARDNAKLSNDMQGFYVYREQRLIHSCDWLGMFSKEPHFTLLRVEFSFDYTLDDAFNVDIKKSRILLNEDIFGYVKDKIMPAPRRAAEERYRKGTTASVKEKARDAHAASNRNIDDKASSVEEAKVTVTSPNEVKIENQHGTFTHKITIRSTEKPGQYRIIPVSTLDDGQLWNPCIVDGRHAVELNQSHPYYQKIYYPILAQNVMVTGMDALLWALAEAELSTFNEETKEQYEDMRIHVSRCLKKLIADLPDPELEEDEL
jgi:predicted  nucleic acid-binding Zn-ribbon protein